MKFLFTLVCIVLLFSNSKPDLLIESRPAIISGGTILDQDGQNWIENGALVFLEDEILWIGSKNELPEYNNAELIDASGKYVIPGLIDAHVHLFDESQLDVLLANGVTSVFNMTGTPRILNWSDEILSGDRIGPRIFTTGPQIKDAPLPFYDGIIAIDSPADARSLVDLHMGMGYDILKIWSSLRPDIYEAIVRNAQDKDLRVTGHVPSRVGLKGALASGQESIAHIEELTNKFFNRQYDRHGIKSAINILKEHQVPVITTLITYEMIVETAVDSLLEKRLQRPEMRYFDPALGILWNIKNNEYRNLRDRKDQFAEGHAFHMDLAKELHDAGIELLAGSDAGLFMPTILPGYALHRELQLLSDCGISNDDVLQMATSLPGRYLERGAGLGQIRIGAPADLLVLDENPFENIENSSSIHAVIAQGKHYSRQNLDEMMATLANKHDLVSTFSHSLFKGNFQQIVDSLSTLAEMNRSAILPSEESLLVSAYTFASKQEMEKADRLVELARMLFLLLSCVFPLGSVYYDWK